MCIYFFSHRISGRVHNSFIRMTKYIRPMSRVPLFFFSIIFSPIFVPFSVYYYVYRRTEQKDRPPSSRSYALDSNTTCLIGKNNNNNNNMHFSTVNPLHMYL